MTSRQEILRTALAVLLPTAADTSLLRAILYRGSAGREAWRHWLRSTSHPRDLFQGEQKGLIPLLQAAVVRNGLEPDAPLANRLRAAHLREELRGNAYRRILGETLVTLSGRERPPVVLQGCALSDTVYDDPSARHSHGIQLLVPEPDLERATDLVSEAGFTPLGAHRRRSPPFWWRHSSGLPLVLRTRLFERHAGPVSLEALWARTRPLPGFPASMLGPEDALLHVCSAAARSARRHSLLWACDAWFLLERHRALDWTLLVSFAEAARVGLPLSVMMRYLAEDLGAPVPGDVLAALGALASRTDAEGHEYAVLGALAGTHVRMLRMLAAGPDWRSRLTLARVLLAPSPGCVQRMGHVAHRWQLPLYYLLRLPRYVGRRLARLGTRLLAGVSRRSAVA